MGRGRRAGSGEEREEGLSCKATTFSRIHKGGGGVRGAKSSLARSARCKPLLNGNLALRRRVVEVVRHIDGFAQPRRTGLHDAPTQVASENTKAEAQQRKDHGWRRKGLGLVSSSPIPTLGQRDTKNTKDNKEHTASRQQSESARPPLRPARLRGPPAATRGFPHPEGVRDLQGRGGAWRTCRYHLEYQLGREYSQSDGERRIILTRFRVGFGVDQFYLDTHVWFCVQRVDKFFLDRSGTIGDIALRIKRICKKLRYAWYIRQGIAIL